MVRCPGCGTKTERQSGQEGLFWSCPGCHGVSSMISALRKVVPRDVVNSLWNTAKNGNHPCIRGCPACSSQMAEVSVDGGEFAIDICPACAFVWFDAGEFQQLPETPQEVVQKPIHPELARLTVMHKVEHIREQARRKKSSPEEAWKYIPALLGVPVEFDCERTRCAPIVTWSLLAIVTGTSLLGFAGLLSPATFGLIPAEWNRMGGLTFLSYFFLHGGTVHLLGNLYFLYVFGDNVEDFLGRKKYLMLLVDATLAGGAAYVLWNRGSMTPCIGASAGISGILTYYALRFPKYRIGILFFFCKWIRFPVMGYFAFWVLIQIIGAYGRTGHVAYMAHIGGLLAGVLFWLIERNTRPTR